jgi:hypothetical protein
MQLMITKVFSLASVNGEYAKKAVTYKWEPNLKLPTVLSELEEWYPLDA